MIEPHPLTTAIAQDLAAHLPWTDATTRELEDIASLAAALDLFGAEIQANGCDTGQARAFSQIHGRLRDHLDALDCDIAGTMAAAILARSDALTRATLALMPAAGSA